MTDFYSRRSPVTGKDANPMEESRFVEVPTFMRTPMAMSLDGLDVGLVGVPFDAGVTFRPGARLGPREMRNQSTSMRKFHPATRLNPFAACRVADLGDVRFENFFDLEAAHDEITAFYELLKAAGVRPITAGGDHSISYPILRGLRRGDGPVSLIHVDAHTDTWGEYKGTKSHHGSPFRRAIEDELIDPKRTVQIGIRGAQNITEGWDYSLDAGMRVIFMDEVARLGIDAVVKEARRVVGDGPTYLSFDIDSLDPAFAPGTGTLEIGGLTTLEAQLLVRGFRGLDLIGADVVEVAPPLDPTGVTALAGATMMYEILCLMAEKKD